jgi:archaeosine synthase beta-subunit
MSDDKDFVIDDHWIISRRGKKNPVDQLRPYGWLVEKELTPSGVIEDTGIIFLTNRECPFHCLMCDLWQNTTNITVSVGDIPEQIDWALNKMPAVRHLKLYNSGSFFDIQAIPEQDYKRIASLLSNFETVTVESHPRFINERVLHFRDMLKADLHVALGLETVKPDLLHKLNKRMTLDDFTQSVDYLKQNFITSRAFILLRPPFLSESEGIYWAERSIDFAFYAGVECCTVIPVRAGNGAMDLLFEQGYFIPPDIHSLEAVLEYGIGLKKGCVFADVWDLGQFSKCGKCIEERTGRLIEMNLTQNIPAPLKCDCKYDGADL